MSIHYDNPQYVPSFPFYDAEPYWRKRNQGSGDGSGGDGGSGIEFGSLSSIGAVDVNGDDYELIGQSLTTCSVSIVANGQVIETGSMNVIASGLTVRVDSVNASFVLVVLDEQGKISSYEPADDIASVLYSGYYEFTMPELDEDKILVVVFKDRVV